MSTRYTGGIVTKNPQPLNPAAGNAANGVFTMDQYTQAVQNGTWPAYDPYFDQTTLLLHGNGTNGAQNNTFLDSSTNNFTITRNGNTTQGTFSPFSKQDGSWGNYFGTNGALIFSSNAAYAIGTGNFTVECFANFSEWSGTFQRVFIQGVSGTTNVSLGRESGGTALNVDINTTNVISYTWTPNIGQWYHLAVVRTGTGSGQVALYIDGVSVATGTSSASIGQNQFIVGGLTWAGGYNIRGYLSNFRYSNTARTITVPDAPYTSDGNTLILTCQSNRFVDNSSNNFTISPNGSVTVTPFSPFTTQSAYSPTINGGSGYFDGSGDYLSLSNSAAPQGTEDFSVECWMNLGALSADAMVFESPLNGGFQVVWTASTNTISVGIYGTGAVASYAFGYKPLSEWHHYVFTRSGNAFRLFVDGVLRGYGTNTITFLTTTVFTIAARNGGTVATNGYFSGVRIVRGSIPTGYQTASTTTGTSIFTPPTAPVTTSSQGSSSPTLLCNFTNAGIIDSTMSNNLETAGNAQIDTAVKKFGDGSLEFDGNGDYLVIPNTSNLQFGTGDFTIEGWYYPLDTNQRALFSIGQYDQGILMRIGTHAGSDSLYINNTAYNWNPQTYVGTNAWYHIALVRYGSGSNNVKIYVNGTSIFQATNTSSIADNDVNMIGRPTHSAGEYFNGYIDEFRITKGVARYTSNFAVPYLPTQPLPLNGGSYAPYTALMLPGTGTNGAQNNTFLDSSTNNFTITRNGNTTQGTFSPFSREDGYWGNYFDGSGDYLSIADNAAFDFGTGDFTIEFWMRFAALPSSAAVAMISTYSSGSDGYYIQYRTDLGGRNLRFGNSSTVFIDDTAFNPNVNQWYHIAVARSGTALRMYIDGVVSSSTATTSNNFVSTVPFLIGHLAAGTQPFNGYISNVRVVKGTAVYTSNFTPSSSPLTNIANTSLLTCQSKRFVDNSSNNFAITVNGDVKVSTFSPFGYLNQYSPTVNGGSGYFDGSGDSLTVTYNASMAPGSNDFTIEGWYYITETGTTELPFFIIGSNTYYPIGLSFLDSSGYKVQVNASYNGSSWAFNRTGNITVSKNTWVHVALVRNSTALDVYVNGVKDTSASGAVSGSLASDTGGISIGAYRVGGTAEYNGYISNTRYVNGTAVYTSNFTPPNAPVTEIANTSLLTNFTNAGIYDASMSNDLETVGNAQISTSVSKFGGGSMAFDGTGDYIVSAANSGLSLGAGAFTVEMWIYPASFATYISVWCCTNSTGVATGFHIGFNASGQMFIYSNSAFRISSSSTSGTLTLNQWNHLAVIRSNGIVSFFVNGVQATSTWSTTQDFSQGFNLIGATPSGGSEYFNGYISNLRILKGVALLPTALQTSQWQDQ